MEADLILHAFDENLLERVIFSDLQFSSNYIKTEPVQQLPLNDHFSELTVNHTKNLSAPFDCPVCGQEAGKHTHYGGRGCSSCRAFFRRSVQSGAYQSFKCRSEPNELHYQQCDIDSKSWKSCKFCRFHKCLQSGMKPAYVLNEEERKIRHHKRTSGSSGSLSGSLSGSRSPGSASGSASPKIISLPAISTTLLNNNMTEDEIMVFEQSQSHFKNYMSQQIVNFYEHHPGLFKIVVSGMYFRTNIPFQAWQALNQAFSGFLRNYMSEKPEFDGISTKDKKTLVDNNSALVGNVAMSVGLGNHFVSERLLSFFQRIFDKDVHNPLKRVLDELNINTWPQNSIEYKQVFTSPWAPHITLEERDEELTKKISKWPLDNTRGGNEKNIDGLMMFYLSNILLFSTDFLPLENPQRVALVQTKYLKMLHRYLKSKYDQDHANNRFGNGIMIASFARESHEIRRKRLPV